MHALTPWCEPRLADGPDVRPDAWLASGPSVSGVPRAVASGKPVGVVDDGAVVDDRVVRVALPPGAIDAAAVVPVTPYVRARWRTARGLPADLVVDADGLDADSRPTALALAAAVVARGDRLVEALAWGAPCATDVASAELAGAVDGVHVAVAGGAELPAAAAALVADQRRAAALGRAGRRLVEERHDLSRLAAGLACRLGLAPQPGPLERRLDELWTPRESRIRGRAGAAVGGLGS